MVSDCVCAFDLCVRCQMRACAGQDMLMPGPRRHQLLQTSMQALRPGLIQMEASRNREKARVEAVTGGRQAETRNCFGQLQ